MAEMTFLVAPLSNWMAALTAAGYTFQRMYRDDGSARPSYEIELAGQHAGLLIKYDASQYSRWACNVLCLKGASCA